MRMIANRPTEQQTDWHIDKLMNTTVVNAGPPDTEYLYYPLDVEGVTLKSSLLPAHIR